MLLPFQTELLSNVKMHFGKLPGNGKLLSMYNWGAFNEPSTLLAFE